MTDAIGYGKAFGKAMLTFTVSFFASGIAGLFGDTDVYAAIAVVTLIVGMIIGTVAIIIVQKKYNGGLF